MQIDVVRLEDFNLNSILARFERESFGTTEKLPNYIRRDFENLSYKIISNYGNSDYNQRRSPAV